MVLSSAQQKGIDTSEKPVSRLNTQSMVSPVNASRQPSRTAAHHSGPGRLARPYTAGDFHLLSFASLSWRSPLMAMSGGSGHVAVTSGLPPAADFGQERPLSHRFRRLHPREQTILGVPPDIRI